MPLNFVWESALPTRPSAKQVQESIEYALGHFSDPRGLRAGVVSAYLQQDQLKLKVVGVGYSKDEKRLVTFHYSLQDPITCLVDYYENPLHPQR